MQIPWRANIYLFISKILLEGRLAHREQLRYITYYVPTRFIRKSKHDLIVTWLLESKPSEGSRSTAVQNHGPIRTDPRRSETHLRPLI